MSPMLASLGALAGFGMLPGGAFESIATVTVGSGGASSITFSDIPGGFQHLQVRLIVRTNYAGADDVLKLSFNATTTGHGNHYLSGNGSGVFAGSGLNGVGIYYGVVPGSPVSANMFGASVMDILDYGSTTKNKTTRSLDGSDRNGSGSVALASGLWANTSAISSMKIESIYSSSFVQYTTASLYGMR